MNMKTADQLNLELQQEIANMQNPEFPEFSNYDYLKEDEY